MCFISMFDFLYELLCITNDFFVQFIVWDETDFQNMYNDIWDEDDYPEFVNTQLVTQS